MKVKKFFDLYLPTILLFGLGAYFLTDTKDITPDALIYPRALAILMIVLAAVSFIVALLSYRRETARSDDDKDFKKLALAVTATVAYCGLMPFLGFVTSSFLFCFGLICALGYSRRGVALVVSGTLVALIWLGFRVLLKVPVPKGIFFGGGL